MYITWGMPEHGGDMTDNKFIIHLFLSYAVIMMAVINLWECSIYSYIVAQFFTIEPMFYYVYRNYVLCANRCIFSIINVREWRLVDAISRTRLVWRLNGENCLFIDIWCSIVFQTHHFQRDCLFNLSFQINLNFSHLCQFEHQFITLWPIPFHFFTYRKTSIIIEDSQRHWFFYACYSVL